MKKLSLALFFAVFAFMSSAQAAPPVPTTSSRDVLFVGSLACQTYAGTYGILRGYTMGTGYFNVYSDWSFEYTGGCARPATRMVGNRVVDFIGVTYLDSGAMSGGGTDRDTYVISIDVGQLNDDGSEFYSNVRISGWLIAGASASVSFNPRQAAGVINFYFPLATSPGQDAAFRQMNCRFFVQNNTGMWKGFVDGTDYQDGGRNTTSISIGQCTSSPSNIAVPPTPGRG